jgi:hypothetical protein
MSIELKTFNEAVVTPKDDAYKDNFLIGASGVFEGCQVTALGGLQLQVASGRGVICGRHFVVSQQTVNATPSDGGTKLGRLLIKVDIENVSAPIDFVAQMAASLPALVQEDINADGTIYELPLATYSVTEVAVSSLVPANNAVPDIKPHEHNVDDIDPGVEGAVVGTFIFGTGQTPPAGTFRAGMFYAQLEE